MGIGAARAFASFELWCLLLPVVKALSDASLTTIVCMHVDDLCLIVRADSEKKAILETVVITNLTIEEFTNKRWLPFADEKAFVIATNKRLAEQVATCPKGIKPSTGTTVRRLGVDYTLAKTRSHASSKLPVRKTRMKAAKE
jgi:hypothetical protein